MTRDDERPCPVCGARAGEALHHRAFVLPDGHPLAGGYNVVTCAECGVAYATPLPDQAEYDRYYRDASKYADAATGTGSGTQAWDDRRLEETARAIALVTPDKNTHIVDIGCGAGGLLRWLARLGYTKLTGIDPASACADATGAIPGVRGIVGSLFAPPVNLEPAGMIVLSHVLEHVRDVGTAIDGLRKMLAADGRVYAEVPNASQYTEFLVSPFLDFNTEHINHFSVGTLKRLFVSHGWNVSTFGTKTIASSPTTRYPAAWIVAAMAKPGDIAEEMPADRSLRMALARYINASQLLLARVIERCEELRIASREIIIWGTGQTTAILLAETPLGSATIRAFADSNPMHFGRTISGAPVVPPDALRAMPDIPIVIGSLLHGSEIAETIAGRGLTNPVIRLDPGSQ